MWCAFQRVCRLALHHLPPLGTRLCPAHFLRHSPSRIAFKAPEGDLRQPAACRKTLPTPNRIAKLLSMCELANRSGRRTPSGDAAYHVNLANSPCRLLKCCFASKLHHQIWCVDVHIRHVLIPKKSLPTPFQALPARCISHTDWR